MREFLVALNARFTSIIEKGLVGLWVIRSKLILSGLILREKKNIAKKYLRKKISYTEKNIFHGL